MNVRRAAVLLAAGLCASACTNRHSNLDSSTEGYVVPPTLRWLSPKIPVCWENGSSKEALAWKQTWQDVISKEYSKTSVRFTNWNRCVKDSEGIRIELYGESDIRYKPKDDGTQDVLIDNSVAYARQYRAVADGHPRSGIGVVKGVQPANMIMNTTLTNVNENLTKMAAEMTPARRRNLVITTMLHELGHRIGLYHEQARPDSACTGESDSNWGAPGGIMVGPDDPHSIMNYCLTHHDSYNDYLHLSSGDIAAINTLYGKTSSQTPREEDDL